MRSLTFLIILFVTAYAASRVDHAGGSLNGFVFNGFISGLFALLGVVLGVADEKLPKRLGVAAFGAFGLSLVFLLRPQFNVWELLLSICRLIVLGAAFIWVRRSWNVVFTCRSSFPIFDLGKPKLSHLFGFITTVAILLSFMRFLKHYNGPGGNAFLVVVTAYVGIFAALIPLLAATAALGQRDLSAVPLFALAILMLATCMGVFSFSQTDSWLTGLRWSLNSILEALTIASAVLALRLGGYKLIRAPTEFPRL